MAEEHDFALNSEQRLAKKVCQKSRRCCGAVRAVKHRLGQRPHVKFSLLRVPESDPWALEEASAAEAAVANAAASMGALQDEEVPRQTAAERTESEWAKFQRRILRAHEWRILKELGPATTICPLDPEEAVKARFLKSLPSLEHAISLGYHGTHSKNISSICKRGLLKPGHGGVKVEHGSAHGVGIYTAKVGSASLSKQFVRGSTTLFVCAICDTSQPTEPIVKQPFVPSSTYFQTRFPKQHAGMRSLGQRNLLQESEEVIHVGDAMVVFDEGCVVPLFTADFGGGRNPAEQAAENPAIFGSSEAPSVKPSWQPAQQVGRRRLAIPEPGQPGVLFPRPGVAAQGRTVWLPPRPKENATAHEKAVQRRRNSKHHDIHRHQARSAKQRFLVSDEEPDASFLIALSAAKWWHNQMELCCRMHAHGASLEGGWLLRHFKALTSHLAELEEAAESAFLREIY